MSKKWEMSTGPFTLWVDGPETAAEFDALGGNAVEEAVYNYFYRGHSPAFWDEFVKQAEKKYGIALGVDEDKTAKAKAKKADAKDVKENEQVYERRLRATLTNGKTDEEKAEIEKEYFEFAQSVVDGVKFDPTKSRRASGPGKEYLAIADDILTNSEDKVEEKVTKLLAFAPAFELERDEASGKPERVSLGFLCRTAFEAQKRAMFA